MSPAYWQSGVKKNVAVAALLGWTQCYKDTYADGVGNVTAILNSCSGSKLLLACRPTASSTLTLAAMGARSDVTFATGAGAAATHTANGVAWYFDSNSSIGFAPQGDNVDRNSCDLGGLDGDLRLCWHTSYGTISRGYRCGTTIFISDAGWERVIYSSP